MNEREKIPWQKDTTLQSNPPEGRDLKTYEAMLGFKISDLKGKILDLGSGRDELFSKQAESANKDIKVFSLNPDYVDEHYRTALYNAGVENVKPVAGLAQELPFKDQTFDYIFANFSMTIYSDPKEMDRFKEMWISELHRALKPEGEARLYPFIDFDIQILENKYKNFLKTLTSQGFIYRFEPANLNFRGINTFRLIIKKS